MTLSQGEVEKKHRVVTNVGSGFIATMPSLSLLPHELQCVIGYFCDLGSLNAWHLCNNGFRGSITKFIETHLRSLIIRKDDVCSLPRSLLRRARALRTIDLYNVYTPPDDSSRSHAVPKDDQNLETRRCCPCRNFLSLRDHMTFTGSIVSDAIGLLSLIESLVESNPMSLTSISPLASMRTVTAAAQCRQLERIHFSMAAFAVSGHAPCGNIDGPQIANLLSSQGSTLKHLVITQDACPCRQGLVAVNIVLASAMKKLLLELSARVFHLTTTSTSSSSSSLLNSVQQQEACRRPPTLESLVIQVDEDLWETSHLLRSPVIQASLQTLDLTSRVDLFRMGRPEVIGDALGGLSKLATLRLQLRLVPEARRWPIVRARANPQRWRFLGLTSLDVTLTGEDTGLVITIIAPRLRSWRTNCHGTHVIVEDSPTLTL